MESLTVKSGSSKIRHSHIAAIGLCLRNVTELSDNTSYSCQTILRRRRCFLIDSAEISARGPTFYINNAFISRSNIIVMLRLFLIPRLLHRHCRYYGGWCEQFMYTVT